MPTPRSPREPLGRQYKSLSDLVYRRLRDQILWGVISPGSVLSVRALAEQLSVSPMPVREALLRLSVEGLVEVAPRSSTRVTNISLERVREICEMRNYLEPLAARLAAARLVPADVEYLRRCLKKMDQAASANRPREWHRWNQAFHTLIFRRCGNSLLDRMAQDMWERNLHHFTAGSVGTSAFRARRAAEHERIVRAIERRDPRATEAAWRKHTTQSGIETLDYLRQLTAKVAATGRARERRRNRNRA